MIKCLNRLCGDDPGAAEATSCRAMTRISQEITSAIKIGSFNNRICEHGANDCVQRTRHASHVVVQIDRLKLATHTALGIISGRATTQKSNALMRNYVIDHGVKQIEVPAQT